MAARRHARQRALALAQTAELRALSRQIPSLATPDAIETLVIKTTGDAARDRSLAAMRTDVAVHSLKDLELFLPQALGPPATPRGAERNRESVASLRNRRAHHISLDLPIFTWFGSSKTQFMCQSSWQSRWSRWSGHSPSTLSNIPRSATHRVSIKLPTEVRVTSLHRRRIAVLPTQTGDS